jgi:DNA-binding HxlR family transcriptional regulator
MVVLDLLGRRWALRIGWELRSGPLSFNDLQRACDDISPSVLSERLREGADLGSIERDEAGRYRLSSHGRRLLTVLRRLDTWARQVAPARVSRPRRR